MTPPSYGAEQPLPIDDTGTNWCWVARSGTARLRLLGVQWHSSVHVTTTGMPSPSALPAVPAQVASLKAVSGELQQVGMPVSPGGGAARSSKRMPFLGLPRRITSGREEWQWHLGGWFPHPPWTLASTSSLCLAIQHVGATCGLMVVNVRLPVTLCISWSCLSRWWTCPCACLFVCLSVCLDACVREGQGMPFTFCGLVYFGVQVAYGAGGFRHRKCLGSATLTVPRRILTVLYKMSPPSPGDSPSLPVDWHWKVKKGLASFRLVGVQWHPSTSTPLTIR